MQMVKFQGNEVSIIEIIGPRGAREKQATDILFGRKDGRGESREAARARRAVPGLVSPPGNSVSSGALSLRATDAGPTSRVIRTAIFHREALGSFVYVVACLLDPRRFQ